MAKYLDPKADVTFKKVFGEHKNLVISLLNALLPLDEGKQVEKIEYLSAEITPRTPLSKDTIVDVRCEETGGRKFIVESCHAATGRELMDSGIVVELSGGCDSAVFEIVDGRENEQR